MSHDRTAKHRGKGRCEYIFNYTGHEEIPPPPPPPHTIFRSPFSYSARFETEPPPPPTSASPRQRISSFVSLVPIQPETESPVPGYFWHSNNTDLICTMPLRANRIAECSFPPSQGLSVKNPSLLSARKPSSYSFPFFFIPSLASPTETSKLSVRIENKKRKLFLLI